MDLDEDLWWLVDETAEPEPELTEKQKAWQLEKARNRAARHKPIPLSDEDVKAEQVQLTGRAARRARERGAKTEKHNRSRIQRRATRRGVRRSY